MKNSVSIHYGVVSSNSEVMTSKDMDLIDLHQTTTKHHKARTVYIIPGMYSVFLCSCLTHWLLGDVTKFHKCNFLIHVTD